MALPFIPSDGVAIALQAAVVAAPRPVPRLKIAERLQGPAWALVPIGSIVVVIFAIRYVNSTATGLTYLALVAVPPLAAAALGWTMRGARPWLALVVAPLFALAWAIPSTLVGQGSAALLSALSVVTLGVLLSMVTPPGWMKVGIVLMACADSWLVITDLLQKPNSVLVGAAPAAGLPQLQSVSFGTVSLGYGDLFVAALLGALLASSWRRQGGAALLVFVLAALFDLLFLVVNELPATVPVAAAVIVIEIWDRREVLRARPWTPTRRGRTRASSAPARNTARP
jgi:hypothetical protein